MPYSHQELCSLARRVLDHHQAGTTDSASDVMRQTIDAYDDPDRYTHEVNAIFTRHPLALALSAELPGPGSYKSMQVMDVPVLMVRGKDNAVRAFINVCTHRGARVCPIGTGESRSLKFACPYHAWTFDGEGKLAGMFGAHTFGDVDKNALGLKALACDERAGFIWVTLTPGVQPDIDDWLAGLDAPLGQLDLQDWHIYRQIEFDGPGWKVAWDGYLEGYHQEATHPETVGKNTIANLMAWDTYGPHQRIVFGRKNLLELADKPEKDWTPSAHIRLIHSAFPNMSVSGVMEDFTLVSQVYPGKTPDRTTTVQTVLARNVPNSDEAKQAADTFAVMALQAVKDEDYVIGASIQAGLRSGGNTEVLFGRNEPSLQHFHQWVEKLSA